MNQEWDSEHSQIVTVQPNDNLSNISISKQLQQQQNPYLSLQTANPILPPGVHKDHETNIKFNLQYRYIKDRQKLNKTTFPELRGASWMNKTHLCANNIKNNIQQEEEQQQQEQSEMYRRVKEEKEHQFMAMLHNKILIYQRVHNEEYNGLGSSAYFCSFFFNVKKESIKSRKTPVYEYLQKICKDLIPRPIGQDTVEFNANFQSGNLLKAYRSFQEHMITYQIYMQNDINTKGCTQWFYFAASAHKRTKVKFRIMNFYKPTSLYMMGMKILIAESKQDWKRLGTSIRYMKVPMDSGGVTYATEFIYQMEKPNVQYRFAYGYPYTYSHLEDFLTTISQNSQYRKILQKSVLCQSYLGNNVYMLTISDGLSSKYPKPIIYIIARQHPGQTPASFVVQGLIQMLLSNRLQISELRQKFIIKIIPLCNVDGVINGNYRANFSGNDINRQWWGPSKKAHPEVYYLKQQIAANKKNAAFFLDIHAHSRKMNSFFYGSKSPNSQNKLYPFVCSKLNKFISFTESSFTDDPSKRTTARVILETEIGIKKSLTFQISFYGYECPEKKIRSHFSREDFKSLGESLAIGLYYSEIGPDKHNYKRQMNKNRKQIETNKDSHNNSQNTSNSKNYNSISCKLNNEKTVKSKKAELQEKIQKNCRKIFDKWKKQLEKYNEDQVFSEGSSLDPEHFQLQQQQQSQIQPLSDHIHRKYQPNINQNKQKADEQNKQQDEDNQESKNDIDPSQIQSGVLIFKNRRSRKKAQNNFEPLEIIEEQDKKQMKIPDLQTSNFKRPFQLQSNLRSTLMVKKLQSELQMHRVQSKRYDVMVATARKSLTKQKQKSVSMKNQLIQGNRFKSIDVIQKKEQKNYRNSIYEMKKALKYFIQNKDQKYRSTDDYDDFKKNLWYASNGRSLVFNQAQKVYEYRKKYRL